jgi:hypothetical protein
MGQLREDLDLAHEARAVLPWSVGDDLDGHHVAGGGVSSTEDLSHATDPDPLLELEPPAQQVLELHQSY